MVFAASVIPIFSSAERSLKMDEPMDFPRRVGMPTKVGSGMSGNFTAVAMDKISFVFLTIAFVISRKEAAGPYSVPPMLSIMNLETVFT